MANMKNLDLLLALQNTVDHAIDVRLAAVEQMPELFALRSDRASVRISFQSEDLVLETLVPAEGCG